MNLTPRQQQILKTKIKDILTDDKAISLTITISNKFLLLDKKTIQNQVVKFLNSQTLKYILNEDYGTENNRLHFHALITPRQDNIKINYINFKLGYITTKSILFCSNRRNQTIEELEKIYFYHITKKSNLNQKIIYSRTTNKKPIKTIYNCLHILKNQQENFKYKYQFKPLSTIEKTYFLKMKSNKRKHYNFKMMNREDFKTYYYNQQKQYNQNRTKLNKSKIYKVSKINQF